MKGGSSMKVLPIDKEFLSTKEAMSYLGCSDDYLYQLRENGEVAYSQKGKMIWYTLRSLKYLVERNMVISDKQVSF